MTAPPQGPPFPEAVTAAARLRRDGRLSDAVELVEGALKDARATPLGTPFRERVLLALTLADLYLLADRRRQAHSLLTTEVAFADHVFALTQQSGSPEQIHAASAGRLQLRDRAAQVELLGNPAPEIEVAGWVQGRPTTLTEQRGRVVLLEFWAPWCPSCVAMFPFFRDLHNRYAEKGLTILAVTSHRARGGGDPAVQPVRELELIRQAVSDHTIEFAVAIASDERLQQRYGANGLPTFALIDRQGIVQFASSKPDKRAIEEAIVSLLNTTINSCS